MRAIVQRVSYSKVTVEGEVTGEIQQGYMVLLGVIEGDTQQDADYMVKKLTGLRVFEDEQEKMNLSVSDVNGSILLVSQFTLAGDVRHGNRPSFITAARPEIAEPIFEYVKESIIKKGIPVETGRFRTHMYVELVNDGPVTILIDSRKEF